jgi:hypothetical protein
LTAGISLPTGDIDETGVVLAPNGQRPMQRGTSAGSFVTSRRRSASLSIRAAQSFGTTDAGTTA